MTRRSFTIFILFMSCILAGHSQRRMVAEWEPAFGTLIRWPLGIPGNLVAKLAEDDSVYVLVENLNQQIQATTAFQSYGVNLDHCRFIIANTYSHWTRDWGPHYVFDENGTANITDPIFNGYPWVPGCTGQSASCNKNSSKGFEEDDAVNTFLATEFDLPLISLPAYLTGGNIMTDGHGFAVSTQQMLDENAPICDEELFMSLALDSLGIDHYFMVDNPEVYGIQHIDCYAKFLDEERILVKELPSWHPEYNCVEELAEFLGNQTDCYSRKYEILRIFCPRLQGNEVAAYTNSLILNKKVLVPVFGISADEQALQTYEELMPGYEVIGFEGNWYYYDALHCRTMGIFDPQMLVIWHKQPKIAQSNIPVKLVARIDDRSETGLKPDMLRLDWREEGNTYWNHIILSSMPEPDSFYAQLPGFQEGTMIEYYFVAADSSGRQEKLPRTAPEGHYSLEISDIFTGLKEYRPSSVLTVSALSFSDPVLIQFIPSVEGEMLVDIYDILGKKVWETDKTVTGGEVINLIWDSGKVKSGIYIIRLSFNHETFSMKIFKE